MGLTRIAFWVSVALALTHIAYMIAFPEHAVKAGLLALFFVGLSALHAHLFHRRR